jgi:hypothetical protein
VGIPRIKHTHTMWHPPARDLPWWCRV